MTSSRALFIALLTLGSAATASAQVTPAAGYTPPDDTPSVRVGATIYTDWTYQQNPKVTDADGNSVNLSSFNVARSYINITGQISHLIGFRITPDVVRESGLVSLTNGSSVSNDSLVFRVKYAFAEIRLDDWLPRGSWVRLGIQQMPLLDYTEGIYRYRWQGTLFTEREGLYNSADAGVSFHLNFPKNYGDVHVGVYNGEGYARPEVNDQKAVEIRGTVRPFAQNAPLLRGIRVTGFYWGDNYIKDAERKRAVGQVTFEHKYVNAAFEGVKANDQTSIRAVDVEASGWSMLATPKRAKENGSSIEALLRYDHLQPNKSVNANRTRTIIGAAYWFPHQGAVTSALMLDYDGQTFHNFATPQPAQKRIALHALINF